MLFKTEKTLLEAGINHNEAGDHLRLAWDCSKFRELLMQNLRSESLRIIEPPVIDGDEYEFDSVIDLEHLVPYYADPKVLNTGLRIHYSLDEFNSKTVFKFIGIPANLIKNTTEKAFDAWAKKERERTLATELKIASETVKTLKGKLRVK